MDSKLNTMTLPPISYHCLEWNLKNSVDSQIENLPKETKHASIKLFNTKFNAKNKNIHYDQEVVEKHYRSLGYKTFHFSPNTFSVDCQQKATNIHKKLLCLSGTDIILLNNPEYFDSINSRITVANTINERNNETQRIKNEKIRLNMEKINFGSVPERIKSSKTNDKLVLFPKPMGETPQKLSDECEKFSYDKSGSFDSMCGDCEQFEFDSSERAKKIQDPFDKEQSMEITYKQARQFIYRKLLEPKEIVARTMNMPTEFGFTRPDLLPPIDEKDITVDQDTNSKKKSFMDNTKLKTCACN